MSGGAFFILSFAYARPELCGSDTTMVLAIHTTVAVAFAGIVTVAQHFRQTRQGIEKHKVQRTFTLCGLFLGAAILALALGLLRLLGASPAVGGCLLLAAAGQPLTAIAVHLLERRRK